MKYRLNKFFARKDYTADTTIVIDLNFKDIISSIIIGLGVSNKSGIMIAHPVACLTKLELVDGSDVLFSLDGYEAEALDWYNNGGKFRYNHNYALINNDIERYIGINFGRWLWDKEYAFDPQRFTNPQLRISLDIDAGGNNADTNKITCWANIFDEEVPSLKGFLMAKEIKEYAIASSVHEYTDLPLDYPYRALFFRPFVYGTEPTECVSNLKLSEDQDRKIPFDNPIQDIFRSIQEDLPPVEEYYYYPTRTALNYLFIAPSQEPTAVAAGWRTTAEDMHPSFYSGNGGRLQCIFDTQGPNAQIHVKGYLPHCVLQIPFGLKNDPVDWYDVRHLGSLRLDITGAATATGFLFLQQLRTY